MSDSRDTSLPWCGVDKLRIFDKFRIGENEEVVKIVAYREFSDTVHVTGVSGSFYVFYRDGKVEKSIRNGKTRITV